MIQTGSSGSYFVRSYQPIEYNTSDMLMGSSRKKSTYDTVAVFKPNDEEPYGDFNPKRVLLRRYLWWAMGRPCLIPSFSYLSEVAASRIDSRLNLGLVPSTRLVRLASASFFYSAAERKKDQLREKVGSYQHFLRGYVNVSAFLRAHPWPSRPRDLLERDLRAENTAHGRAKARARKGGNKKSKTRRCLAAIARLNCLRRRTRPDTCAEHEDTNDEEQEHSQENTDFVWTIELMDDFRFELEKLVCFDYLIRNTDRGLDNFMVKVEEPNETSSRRTLKLAAIDNSLAFPWTHPAGIRSYPWGWLYLPTDLIGGPFSAQTRALFLSQLNKPGWWHQTRIELERLFREDEHFDAKKFEGQMEVLRGQGWNLIESLRSEDEGPLELCARQKQLVRQEPKVVTLEELRGLSGTHFPLTSQARALQSTENQRQTRTNTVEPISIETPGQGKRTEGNSTNFKPMSLPEARPTYPLQRNSSVYDDVNRNTRERQAAGAEAEAEHHGVGNAMIGRAYRRGSLGIDVLAEIDKGTSLKSRRPKLRNAHTGRGRPRKNLVLREEDIHHSVIEDVSSGAVHDGIEDLSASTASFESPQSARFSPPHHNRKRMGSVGEPWSIASALASIERQPREETVRLKVVLEVSGVSGILCSAHREL